MPPNRLGPLACLLLRRFFKMTTELHFPEDAFTLHLLFKGPKRLINIVITNDDLHGTSPRFQG